LLRDVVFVIALIQAPLLKFRGNLFLPHRFGPLSAPLCELGICLCQELADQFALQFQSLKVSGAVLHVVARRALQICDPGPGLANVAGVVLVFGFEAPDFRFGLLHIGFGNIDVGLAKLNQAFQTFEVRF